MPTLQVVQLEDGCIFWISDCDNDDDDDDLSVGHVPFPPLHICTEVAD